MYDLRREKDVRTYGIGLKEVWDVREEDWREGEVVHTMGWPLVASVLKNGKYCARALNEGGYSRSRKLILPGGALSGTNDSAIALYDYEHSIKQSPPLHNPLDGVLYSGIDPLLLKGGCHGPQDVRRAGDAIGGQVQTDRLPQARRQAQLSMHYQDEPVHMQVKDRPKFKGVENRFCPAGVYEYAPDETKTQGVRFQIDAQNCIHCKTCDINIPAQDINWVWPERSKVHAQYVAWLVRYMLLRFVA
ncbi:hypothetical protein V1506DRAFT_556769 [Lipomyces tetrasporus]